jgi:WD40 repeat protein
MTTTMTNMMMNVAFDPNGESVAASACTIPENSTLCEEWTIHLWDIATGEEVGRQPLGDGLDITDMAYSPDQKSLAWVSWDGMVNLWDVETGSVRELTVPETGDLLDIAFSPDSEKQMLASSGEDGKIVLWDMETRRRVEKPLSHLGGLFDITFSPDGKRLASSSFDPGIVLWDVETQQQIGEPLLGRVEFPLALEFVPPDGRLIVSGGCSTSDEAYETCVEGEIRFWDTETRQLAGEPLAEHRGAIRSLAFSPDGSLMASGGDDNEIMLWSVAERQSLTTFSGHRLEVYDLEFSPDGALLASASRDSRVILWDVQARKQFGLPLNGHTDTVMRVAFSPDGKQLASASADSTVILWDVQTGRPVMTLESQSDWVSSVDFSPDGATLVAGGDDGSIQVWTVDRAAWQKDACNIVGRNLTLAEWALYLPQQTPRPTCEQWPLQAVAPPTP